MLVNKGAVKQDEKTRAISLTVVASDKHIVVLVGQGLVGVLLGVVENNVHEGVDGLETALVLDAGVQLDHDGLTADGRKELGWVAHCGLCGVIVELLLHWLMLMLMLNVVVLMLFNDFQCRYFLPPS